MPSVKSYPRDLLVYFAFCALPIAGFWLLGTPGTQFDSALFTVSFVVLLGFKIYYTDKANLLDWDENLNAEGLLYIVLGVLGSLAVATYFTTHFINSATLVSSINVPITKMSLSIGTNLLPPFWNDVLYTLTLTVTAEETSKLVTSLGLYIWLKDLIGGTVAKYVAIIFPIAGWAVLHTFSNRNYQTSSMMVMVTTAFVAGLLMYYAMYKTKSLLAAMLIHGFYNIILLYLFYYG